jgi:hypothetical protein
MLYLYFKFAFFAAKPKRAILFARTILLALVLHMTQQKDSLLMIFLKIFSPEPHLKIARLVGVQELFQNPFLKLAKIFCHIF